MRIKKGLALTLYDRKTFYDVRNPKGYVDYAFADSESEAQYRTSKWAGKWETNYTSIESGHKRSNA